MEKPYKFIWYELMTSDMAAAQAFYGAVVGWTANDFGNADMPYTVVSMEERGIGGIMTVPEEAAAQGLHPCWVGYIGVPDTDAAAEQVKAAGGRIHRAPTDIPNVGRFAVLADPQGAMINLMTPQGEPPLPPLPANHPGTVGWHELYTADEKQAFDFYSSHFGWRELRAMEMGEMGIYRIFGWDDGEMGNGGMMTHPQAGTPSAWLFYACVDDVDSAAQRVREHGGEVLMGPMQVPGGSWIIQANDPQGARFALVSPPR